MSSNLAWRTLGTDLMSLRIFVAVAEEGSLAQAAAREHIAPSAASRRLSYLESRAGVQLFERRERLTLTSTGQDLLGKVRDLFDLLGRIALDIDALRSGARGHIRIHTHMSAISLGLPRLIGAFLKAHPGIDIEFEEQTSFEILHAIRTGMVDVGLVSGGIEHAGVELIPWGTDELVAVVPEGHALSGQSHVSLEDMLPFPFVMMQRDSALRSLAERRAAELGSHLRVRAHAASFETARELVAAQLGVSILPAPAIRATCGSGVLVLPLTDAWATRRLMICVRDQQRLSAAARLFVKHLVPGYGANCEDAKDQLST